jgi:putative ABC transport system substrate-binding protein
MAAAQTGRLPRLAIVATTSPEADITENANPYFRAFVSELRRLGCEEGRTLIVERWSARGETQRYPALAREVVGTKPDVIFTFGPLPAQAFQAATATIPIVVSGGNLVEFGLADSMSRPGRNVTGVGTSVIETNVKGLELLREALPTATRIAFLAARAGWDTVWGRQIREAAPRLGVTVVPTLLDDPVQPPAYRRAFAAMPDLRIDAVMVGDTPHNWAHRQLIAELATAGRLPTVSWFRAVTEAGGLMSYSNDFGEFGRVCAGYIVRVLRGEKPADVPIRTLDKMELAINLKTAKALGLTIPPAILLRADEVIE